MRIFTKLLLALLFTSALLLCALYWLIQLSFDRGLLNYINQKDQQTLTLLAENLARYYSETGSWQTLTTAQPKLDRSSHSRQRPFERMRQRERIARKRPPQQPAGNSINHRDWRLLMILSERGLQYPNDLDIGLTYLQTERPPRARSRPNPSQLNRQQKNEISLAANQQNRRAMTFSQRKPSLLDANKQVLIGRYRATDTLQPITHPKEVIGFVAMTPQQTLTDSFDLSFAQELRQNIALILSAIFAFMVLITIALSRHFVRPITELKNALVALNQGQLTTRVTVNGKDEIATLARNLNDLAATLEQNESSRKRWIADIAHELRTPLAILKGELEAFEDGIRTLSLSNLKSINEEVNHLQKLINDLNELNNSEIGTLNYHKQNLNIVELIELNAARHQYLIEQKQLSFVLNTPTHALTIWADETRLNQLLDNLITNSVKYTDSPGELTLVVEKKNNFVEITVADSAPAVPNEALEQLFDHLFRVENSRNRKTGGLGIGLALAKNIVHAHQGEIAARHSKLGGLAIVIKLPLI